MKTIQSQSTSNACSVSQAAAEAALNGDQSVVAGMTTAYRQRHDYFIAALNEIDGFHCRPGEGTFYAFPHVGDALQRLELKDDVELVETLLRDADLACVPGSAFGAPNYLRLSYACSMQQLEEAVKRIKRVVAA